jgi:serine/threonine protein phosphatase 1
LPPDLRVYAVGDIHGRLDLLERLLASIEADIASRPAARLMYVFLGDYIDRGSASRETIDRLIAHAEASETVLLKGNHESLAIKCLTDRGLFEQWLRLGGLETLASYGVQPEMRVNGRQLGEANGRQLAELHAAYHGALPQKHFRFFRDLQTSFTCGDFFFAHAGAKPNVALSRQKENDLLWIRGEFLSSNYDFGKIVIHGHTPNSEIDVGPNRINIDTGAFATGRLTCLVLEGESLSVIDTSP